jgi:beta-mannosidase
MPTTTRSLDGSWRFRCAALRGDAPRDRGLDRWMPATMPGTVHFHLQKLGKIGDARVGRIELDQQWVDEQDWELQTTITASAADCLRARQELVFDGIDTVATIRLNGKVVGRSANMFRQVVCGVAGVLEPGVNDLRILLSSPTRFSAEQAERGHHRVDDPNEVWTWRFGWQTGEFRDNHRAWIRKVQCHFGWDWGLFQATSGVWQPARLECSDAPRLASLVTVQEHRGPLGDPTHVRLRLQVRVQAAAAASGTIVITCGGAAVRVRARAKRGESIVAASMTIRDPRLWWPAGEGDQALYDLTASWENDDGSTGSMISKRIGLRTLELVTDQDRSSDGHPGESFYFRVNGRAIFARGANWIPADQLVDRCTPAVYRHLLGSMVEAHMNMVRVWGGGWYEQDAFYDLCDELGLLVWQDFMMACAVYPDTRDFIRELTAEARYQVRRLADHPSIALWCGDNENAKAVWQWWAKKPGHARRVGIYRKTLGALRKACESEDATRRFWLSSPSNDEFGGEPDDANRGDVHYWNVWHGGQPFSDYYNVKPRFCSEFGFQSFPEPRTLTAVVAREDLNPSSRVMEHHQRSGNGNVLITNTMAREMPIPKDFPSFCFVSQINQAMAIRTAVEHWRRLKPWCMGAIYWQVNDLWPVASWSSIDYHGRWKTLHHAASRFFAPLLASIVPEKDGKLTVWATSDLPAPASLAGTLEIVAWSGERIARVPMRATLKAGESRALKHLDVERLLAGKAERHQVCCFVRLAGTSGGRRVSADNFATLVPWKWAAVAKPRLNAVLRSGRDGLALRLSSASVVPFVHAELAGTEGHFRGDWQVLQPGRSYDLPWIPHRERGQRELSLAEARKRLRVTSLYDFAMGG